jgi:uncharacterized protein
MQEHATY